MLKFHEVSLSIAGRPVLDCVSLTINGGERVGVVGPNGAGKSTLLGLCAGALHADSGQLTLPRATRIARVEQHDVGGEQPCIEFVLDGDIDLREAEATLAAAQAAGDGEAQAHAHGRLAELEAYSARATTASMLAGLGFAGADIDRPVNSFSGGWRMRLALARALVRRSDMLLLDEPTNHLDLEAVVWLQNWLSRYPGTLLVVAHDREFLDAVVNRIVHVTRHGVRAWRGNYSAFELARAEQLAAQSASYARQQREIAHIQSFVERFRAKASKARQAQSRIKALERLELIAPAHVDSEFHFRIEAPERTPRPLLRAEQVALGYDGTAILDNVKLQIDPGMRVGILGANGAGKSTLVRLLAGKLAPLAGQFETAENLKVGYFAQSQLEQLDATASPLLHLRRLDGAAREQDLRKFLGGYGFSGPMAEEPAGVRSGGERARLTLALLAYQRPHLLLLDEPTNHLDLDMRHALTVALQAYAGTVVLVSHDRHLLRVIPDTLWWVHDGNVAPFDGDLDDYLGALRAARSAARPADRVSAVAAVQAARGVSRGDKRKDAAALRDQLKPLRKTVRQHERESQKFTAELAKLDTALEDPALYNNTDAAELARLTRERASVAARLARAEEAWLEAAEQVDAAETALRAG